MVDMTQMYVVFMLNRRVCFNESDSAMLPKRASTLSLFNPDSKTLKDLPKFISSHPNLKEIYSLAQGGTAVGTGLNTRKNFKNFIKA